LQPKEFGMKNFTAFVIAAGAATLSGCAAVNSTPGVSQSSGGLMYYMPKRDVLITVTTSGGKIGSITAAPSPSYADRGKTYELTYQGNLLAKNTLNVEVNEAGLLTSSQSNQTGDAVTALAGLGTLAGYVRGSNLMVTSDAPNTRQVSATGECAQDGTYTYLIQVTETTRLICSGINVKISRRGWTQDGEKTNSPVSTLTDEVTHAGIFYRTNLPYLVTVESTGLKTETIVHSPTESATHFLRLSRTAFSNNDAKLTFANGAGVLSGYMQNTEGEGAALLKLPATIVSSYFSAIGQLFTAFSTRRTSQVSDMDSNVALQLAKLKFESCLKAIEAKDADLIASLKCKAN